MKKEIIKRSSDYIEKQNRIAPISGWLDERLEDILNNLGRIHNEGNIEKKNNMIRMLMSYLNGVQDGNRFGKPNPYNEENPKVNGKGSRILNY